MESIQQHAQARAARMAEIAPLEAKLAGLRLPEPAPLPLLGKEEQALVDELWGKGASREQEVCVGFNMTITVGACRALCLFAEGVSQRS
jgi:hypothetical protein